MTIDMVLRSPSLCIPVKFSAYSELTGKDGVGVPTGGKTGQVLKKKSDTDFDTEWQDDIAGGGGTVVTLEGVAQPTFPADSFMDDAIAKKVVDGAPSNLDTFGKVASALVGKVDKSTSKNCVYANDTSGNLTTHPITRDGAKADTIPLRRSGGRIATGTATEGIDAVPLAQMNEALTKKAGVEVEGKVDSLEKKVENLWAGQAPDMFFDDDATAYVKEIPDDVAPYAAVKSVGGMIHTHQLPPPNLFNASVLDAEQSKDGINFWVGGSGVYSVTPDDYFSSSPFVTTAKFKEIFPNSVVGKKYTLTYDAEYSYDAVYGTTAGSIYPSGTFTLTNEIWESGLQMGVAAFYEQADTYYGETTYSNITLTEEGGGERYLTEAKVTALDIVGRNLYNGGFGGNACATEENGVLTMTMTAAGDRWAKKWFPPFPMAEVTISTDVVANGLTSYFNAALSYDNGVVYYPNIAAPSVTGHRVASVESRADGAKITAIDLYLQVGEAAGTSVKMKNFMILPTATPTDTTYSPYHKHTFAIPEAVQALDGYGWGIPNGAHNGVEWDKDGRPSFIKRIGKVVCDGTEEWSMGSYSGHTEFSFRQPDMMASGKVLCNRYKTGYVQFGEAPCLNSTPWTFVFYPVNINTLDGWKAQLAEWYAKGDPLTVYYELKEPIVTDISHLITEDNLIPVEGGGVIVAVNENEEAAPTTIRYQVTGATLADAFDQIHEYAMQKIGGTT